jgi:hypothetical protein
MVKHAVAAAESRLHNDRGGQEGFVLCQCAPRLEANAPVMTANAFTNQRWPAFSMTPPA